MWYNLYFKFIYYIRILKSRCNDKPLIPKQRNCATIILLQKKESTEDVRHYRQISLLPVLDNILKGHNNRKNRQDSQIDTV